MQALNDKFILGSHPVDIYTAVDTEPLFGEWVTWDAETLLMQLPLVKDAVAMDKVLAVKSCAANINVPVAKALAFEKICTAFCNNHCVMDAYQPLFMEEVFYGVKQINLISQAVHGKLPKFKGEVPGYIATVAKVRAVPVLPKPLAFAQDRAAFMTGKSPSGDELELVDSMDQVGLEALKEPASLDSLDPARNPGDRLAAFLIGCYLFDPRDTTR